MSKEQRAQQISPNELLREKLIAFQREIADLKRTGREQEEVFLRRERDFQLNLLEVLDAFDNLERNIQDKQDLLDKTGLRFVKNIRAINRKLLRLLRSRQIEPLEFSDNKAQIEQCKVIDTQSDPTRENEEIISVEKKGYVDTAKNIVVRKAEVVTVYNDLAQGG